MSVYLEFSNMKPIFIRSNFCVVRAMQEIGLDCAIWVRELERRFIRFICFNTKIQEIGLEQHECANSSAEMFAEVKRVFENKLRFEL